MQTLANSWRELAVREVVEDRKMRIAIGIAAFVLATAFGAYLRIPLPITPVPITLQPLFVILAGALLGPALGAYAMTAYLALGLAGAPVFSGGGSGLAWLLGPTGGYLIAYPAAAYLTGVLAGGKDSGSVRLAAALSAGVGVIYLGGAAQLSLMTGSGLIEVANIAVLPFVIGDLLKVLAGVALIRRFRPTSLERF